MIATNLKSTITGFAVGVLMLPAASSAQSHSSAALHGKVTTSKGRVYQGVLRWEDEEAFWDDHFNSGKVDLPYLEDYGKDDRNRTFEVFGRKINITWGAYQSGRQFVSTFGDIQKIQVQGSDEARLTMRDGSVHDVEGVGNDVEATILVIDAALGELEVSWKAIASIEFSQAPAETEPLGKRLYGEVTTSAGKFTGFVQWDKQECLSIDKLDGEEDGVRHAIPFGQIASIERNNNSSARVELRDGRKLLLDDTNDVDDDNRGILIEDPRYGRVEVSWKEFDRLTVLDSADSGADYASYEGLSGALRGEVRDTDGNTYAGQLIYDLDEAYRWELLDGSSDDLTYAIPFHKIREISPRGSNAALVTLVDGTRIKLEDGHDVSEDNSGVLVLDADSEGGILVPWDEVERVRFDA